MAGRCPTTRRARSPRSRRSKRGRDKTRRRSPSTSSSSPSRTPTPPRFIYREGASHRLVSNRRRRTRWDAEDASPQHSHRRHSTNEFCAFRTPAEFRKRRGSQERSPSPPPKHRKKKMKHRKRDSSAPSHHRRRKERDEEELLWENSEVKLFQPLTSFVDDKERLAEELLYCVDIPTRNAILPEYKRSKDEELRKFIVGMLRCMSKKRILRIIEQKEMSASSDTGEEEGEIKSGRSSSGGSESSSHSPPQQQKQPISPSPKRSRKAHPPQPPPVAAGELEDGEIRSSNENEQGAEVQPADSTTTGYDDALQQQPLENVSPSSSAGGDKPTTKEEGADINQSTGSAASDRTEESSESVESDIELNIE